MSRYGGTSSGTYGGAAEIINAPIITSPTFTGSALYADGTVTNPSWAFTSDPDTGAKWVSSGIWAVNLNGAERVRFLPVSAGGAIEILAGTASYVGFGALGTPDAVMGRMAANSLLFGASMATTTSRTELNKAVASIANAAATDVLTVTIPNAAHNATLMVTVMGALGAGGAIGAGSAMATNTYMIGIVRTAGVATVATATAARDAVAVAVAGSETVTATAAVTAMTGAVGATQTFTVQVTITRSAGSSTNHTCQVYARLLNANATGITIA